MKAQASRGQMREVRKLGRALNRNPDFPREMRGMDQKQRNRKKGRFQFSLRTLLVVTTLFAIGCAWVASQMRPARTQRQAVESATSRFGSVYYAQA